VYVTDLLHIPLPLYSYLQTAGPYIYAEEVAGKSAKLTVELPVQNEGPAEAKAELRTEVLVMTDTPF